MWVFGSSLPGQGAEPAMVSKSFRGRFVVVFGFIDVRHRRRPQLAELLGNCRIRQRSSIATPFLDGHLTRFFFVAGWTEPKMQCWRLMIGGVV